MQAHSAAWIEKWETRIKEPIQNTKRYYYRGSIIKICTIILAPWGIYHLLKLRRFLNSYISLATDCLMQGRTITNDGAPGAGKTYFVLNYGCQMNESDAEHYAGQLEDLG